MSFVSRMEILFRRLIVSFMARLVGDKYILIFLIRQQCQTCNEPINVFGRLRGKIMYQISAFFAKRCNSRFLSVTLYTLKTLRYFVRLDLQHKRSNLLLNSLQNFSAIQKYSQGFVM